MFKIMKCTDNKGSITFNGQLKLGSYCCTLPIVIGNNQISIKVKTGKLRINHSAFNIDGGTFTCPPKGKQKQHYDLFECNTYQLTFNVSESFGHLDRIEVVNPSFFKEASFEYIVNKN